MAEDPIEAHDLARALDKASDAMSERTSAIDNLASEVSAATEQLDRIEARLETFAVETDVARRRRLSLVRNIALTVWLCAGVLTLTSVKVETCSPGARAEGAFREIVEQQPLPDLAVIRRELARRVPAVCDIAFPFYTHQLGDDWPSDDNTLGLALYAAAAVVTLAAVRRRPWERGGPAAE